MENSTENIADENNQDLETSKLDEKPECKEENRSKNRNNEPNDVRSNFIADKVKTIKETVKDFVEVSTTTEVSHKTVIESNNIGNNHNEDDNMDYSTTSNEGHNSKEVKSDENQGKTTTDSLSDDKLNQNESKINAIKNIKTEDFNSNRVKVNIPDNEQCDICGQFVNDSDIIYYQGHPQDAVEEFIALTNDKLVLSAGK